MRSGSCIQISLVTIDHSSCSEYLFKYIKLYAVFNLYLMIKQIITTYIIFFKHNSKKLTATTKREQREYVATARSCRIKVNTKFHIFRISINDYISKQKFYTTLLHIYDLAFYW
jgi:hypothetical protein